MAGDRRTCGYMNLQAPGRTFLNANHHPRRVTPCVFLQIFEVPETSVNGPQDFGAEEATGHKTSQSL
jgi:hypothetical protein